MAERRMFAKTIIDSDSFLDMPLSTQALYFHLSMRADDDGFLNNSKKIQRMVGCSDDDLKLLIAKRFIIPFESGVVVIKHWRIHNYIRSDRYKETVYQEEKAQLETKENNVYTMRETLGIPNGYQMETQVRLGKDSIVKDNNNILSDKPTEPRKKYARKPFVPPTLEEIQAYCKERNNNVDAKRFYDYFSVSDWHDSKGEKVKSWKQKIITWENNNKNTSEVITNDTIKRNIEEHKFFDFVPDGLNI